jgi:hypothetical protein
LSPTLLLACELGVRPWQRGFATGVAPRPRAQRVTAGDGPAVLEEMVRATQRFGLPAETRVVSGDEAGRAGLGLHLCLRAPGVDNPGGDSSRLEGHRRPRRAKTARLDGSKWRTRWLRPLAGAKQGWRLPPASERARWDPARCGQGRARVRQMGIVALARQVRMALWPFRETGVLPKGACLKAEGRLRGARGRQSRQ